MSSEGWLAGETVKSKQIIFQHTFFFFFSLFLRETRQCEQGRGRKRERIPSRLHDVSAEPNVGLELMKTVRS